MWEDNQPTCYLISPQGVDISAVRETLASLSVDVPPDSDLPPPGDATPRAVRQAMRSADFVCVVVSDSWRLDGVYIELGIAIGLGKKLFLIIDPNVDVPFALRNYPYVLAAAGEREPLTFHLRVFLQTLKPKVRRQYPPTPPRMPATEPTTTPANVASLSEQELQNWLAVALRSAGTEVVVDQFVGGGRGDGLRPDLLAWLPSAPASLGNQIIFEIKMRSHGPESLNLDSLRQYMRSSTVRTAIVVTNFPKEDVEVYRGDGGYIFVMSPTRLFRELQSGSLLTSLLSERNAFAHRAPN